MARSRGWRSRADRRIVGQRLALPYDGQDRPPACQDQRRLLHDPGVDSVDAELRTRRQIDQGSLLRGHRIVAPEGPDQVVPPTEKSPRRSRPPACTRDGGTGVQWLQFVAATLAFPLPAGSILISGASGRLRPCH
jgi:hypothetical protein